VESNVQSFIEQCVNIMLHEMKRIGDGWQNIHLLIPNIGESIWEWNSEVCQISHICKLFMLINNYVNMRWCIKLVLTILILICVWLLINKELKCWLNLLICYELIEKETSSQCECLNQRFNLFQMHSLRVLEKNEF